jgi:hypothetical protein
MAGNEFTERGRPSRADRTAPVTRRGGAGGSATVAEPQPERVEVTAAHCQLEHDLTLAEPQARVKKRHVKLWHM